MTRHGLVGKFALLSAVCVILLGVGLARVESTLIRNRALQDARDGAQLVAQVALQSHLTAADVQAGLTPTEIQVLDQSFQGGAAVNKIARIKIWAPDGTIVYSDDHSLINRKFPLDEDLQDALRGEISSDVSSLNGAENVAERRFGQLLEVYLPLHFQGSSTPAGAFEMYLPYRSIAAGIAADTHRLYLLTVGGLMLLYLLLFRIVYRASRKIEQQAASLEARARENEDLALRDQLTGLPNRTMFGRLVASAIDRERDRKGAVSVVLMDLDRFKDVNDTLGHDVGDELLTKVGARLARVAAGNESLARLGGDEFAALVTGGRVEAEAFAQRALAEFVEPFQVEGLAVEVAPSIGIASYPSDGEDGQVILSRADIAMYKAKQATSRIEVYSTDIDHYTPDRLVLLGELRRAIEEGQLILHYQPKVDLRTEDVIGLEALVRWEHPVRGQVQPDHFIPLAESSGLIRPLTTWVLNEALAHCRRALDGGVRIPIAVNVSARSLLDGHLAQEVSDVLSVNGVDASLLILEVTESSMVEEGSHVQASLHALREMGVTLAMDDFGTGYSSLAYLQRLPIQELKIDRSFVIGLGEDKGSVPIVRAAVDLGKALDLTVVAEGVETEVAAAILRNVGCLFGQGYHIARPMPEELLEVWLRAPRGGKLGTAS